ncbi:hypothetical protein [Alicyclobacillus fodiniaquatilis]|uniref:Uncharacterized protein n=1 Tax=Alicyclobacillus fodiniaquatilis TaxID=1661150 RepID=A0ABW4JCE4_9BACL
MAKKIRVFIAGDSTAASYPQNKSPMAGWGQMLEDFFGEQVQVCNEAVCGQRVGASIKDSVD